MNKVKMVIESLKKDMENIDVNEIIRRYEELQSVQDIADALGRNHYEVQKVLLALQLRRKKKHRRQDAHILKLQLTDKDTNVETEKMLSEMAKEIDYLHNALDSKETAFGKLNFELKRLRRNAKDISTIETLEADVLEAFTDYCNNSHNRIIEPMYVPIDETKRKEQTDGLIAIYGDTHYGDTVSKKDVPSNAYDYDIARMRVSKFIDNVIMYPRQSENLVIVDLKDTIKGVIHGGLYTSENSFIASIMFAVETNVMLYSTLAGIYNKVRVISTGSNHERTQDTIIADKKYLDYGRLIDNFVAIQLKALNVNNVEIITTDSGYNMFNVNGANIVAFHGDTLRKYIPTDGNQRALLQDVCISECEAPYRHAINGHGHQFIATHNQYLGMNIQNGTLVGNNAYGLQSGFRAIQCSQTIVFVETSGAIQDIRAIDLNDSEVALEDLDD